MSDIRELLKNLLREHAKAITATKAAQLNGSSKSAIRKAFEAKLLATENQLRDKIENPSRM